MTCFKVDKEKIEKLLRYSGDTVNASDILNRESIGAKDFAQIISHNENDDVFYKKLASRARSITMSRFGKVKGLYIPLYLSSSCHNVCTYCGFNLNNRLKRKTLGEDEIKNELLEIYKKGFRNILLVSGELDGFKNINYLANASSIARNIGFHSIAVELGAMDEQSSQKLLTAGAQSFVLYQETYHPETYSKVHLKGKKADYRFRLEGARRAIEAGFRQVTLGFLVGLHENPLFDAVALFNHLSYLKDKYWDVEFSISMPRMTSAEGSTNGFTALSDKKYAQILMALRLAFPEAAINLSTREEPAFRDGMANICVTHLSVESKTSPGGYSEDDKESLEQFKVHDGRNLAELTGALAGIGYDTHLKDWEMELNKV